MTPLDTLRAIYFNATKGTILKDLDRAIAIVKQMPEEDRERAAVYMDGLSQMRSEWGVRGGAPAAPVPGARRTTARRAPLKPR